ncbi:M48 family metallopeptidase [Janibacter sp. G1551]|uniref:M48 metallopeptidase family protein n=1 Tax=Janibacter sp. G1551 TaxID=3420440 RepID=UPI003CFE4CB6
MEHEDVEIRRSRRRRRTVSAYRDGGRTIVLMPAGFTAAQERTWVATMVAKLEAKDRRARPNDEQLAARARELSRTYLGGHAEPSSVRWVTNQNTRWGSCTPSEGTIRLSTRLQGMPAYVVDYVLVHELAHLLVAGHGPRFWALVAAYPRTERARGFLDGVSLAKGLPDLDASEETDVLEDDVLADDGPADDEV